MGRTAPPSPPCNTDLASLGGSYCTTQSTLGISQPRAATSVQSRTSPPWLLLNLLKQALRSSCFCLPCKEKKAKLNIIKKYFVYLELTYKYEWTTSNKIITFIHLIFFDQINNFQNIQANANKWMAS